MRSYIKMFILVLSHLQQHQICLAGTASWIFLAVSLWWLLLCHRLHVLKYVHLSTRFPIFFPLRRPLCTFRVTNRSPFLAVLRSHKGQLLIWDGPAVPYKAESSFSLVSFLSFLQVWYEWCVTAPSPSPMHNSNGRSYWVGLWFLTLSPDWGHGNTFQFWFFSRTTLLNTCFIPQAKSLYTIVILIWY